MMYSCSRKLSGLTYPHVLVAFLLLCAALLAAGSLALGGAGTTPAAAVMAPSDAQFANPADAAGADKARSLALKGKHSYEQARFAEALNYYTQAGKLDPANAEIQSGLDYTARNLELQKALREGLAMKNEKESDAVKRMYAHGAELMKAGQYSQARDEFYRVWLLAGDYSSTRKNLDAIAEKMAAPAGASPTAATGGVQMAAEASPTNVSERDATLDQTRTAALEKQKVQAALDDAEKLLKAGELDGAELAYRDIVKTNVDDKDALNGLKRVEKARAGAADVERERQVAERETMSKQLLADAAAAAKSGDLVQAATIYKDILTKDPENKKAAKGLASLEESKAEAERRTAAQKAEEARKTQEAEAKSKQAQIEQNLAAAAAARKSGNLDEAGRLYDAVLAMDDGNKTATTGLDRVAAARAEAQGAQERQMAEKERVEREARFEKLLADADAQRADGKFDDALATLAEAKQLTPDRRTVAQVQSRIEKDREAAAAEAKAALDKKAKNESEKAIQTAADVKAKETSEKKAIAQVEADKKPDDEAAKQAAADAKAKEALDKKAAAEAKVKEEADKAAAKAKEEADKKAAAEAKAQEEADKAAAKVKEDANRKAAAEAKPAEVKPPELKPAEETDKKAADKKPEAASPAEAPKLPAEPAKEAAAPSPDENKAIQALLTQAQGAYANKDIAKARTLWQQVVEKSPTNKVALSFLEETAEEFERLIADEAKRKAAVDVERQGLEKLKRPVTISTVESTPLVDFLDNLRFPSGLNFNVADGKEALVDCSFVDKTTEEILNTLLPPMGLKWERTSGDIIQITADLKSRVFHLTPENMNKVKVLMENKTLQRVLWGDNEKPLKSTELVLDEREALLMVVDSQAHITKLESFLQSMGENVKAELVTRIYAIKEKDGPEIKSLVDAVLHSKKTPFDLDRGVWLAGKTLIVRDTPDNLTKIEELLNDRNLVPGIVRGKLEVRVFDVLPTEAILTDPSQAQDFFESTREVIETFLYAEEGKAKAAEEGRRLWADAPNFQITITDYSDRLRRVADYLGELRQIQQPKRQEVIPILHQPSDIMAQSLQQILGASGGIIGGGVGGGNTPGTQQQTFQLTDPQTPVRFMGIEVRLRRVQDNNVTDTTDDSCDLTARTNTQSQNITLNEFESQFVDNFELFAQDIRPGAGRAGGRVTLVIRLIPPAGIAIPGAAATAAPGAPGTTLAPAAPTSLIGTATAIPPEITSFPGTNALIIRYEDPSDLATIQDLIKDLDETTPQAEIDTKFVTVNEERAKEFSAQFKFLDRSDPRNIGIGILDVVNSPTAGLVPVLGGVVGGANAITEKSLNGSFNDSVNLDGVLSNFLGKYVDWQMRMLEVEGVASITNGPHVTVQNNTTAQFTLGGLAGVGGNNLNAGNIASTGNSLGNTGTTGVGNTGTNNVSNVNNNANANVNNQLNSNSQNTSAGARTAYVGGQLSRGLASSVLLDVLSIQILSDESIILNLDLIVNEAPNWIARNLWNDASNGFSSARGGAPLAVPGTYDWPYVGSPSTENKSLITTVSVRSGGTIVLGGWMGETNEDLTGGVPGLRNMPWIGKLFFSHNVHTRMRTNLLIFLSAQIIK